MTAPWDLAPHLPWSLFTSPASRWAVMPSFVIGEYLFYVCVVLAFVHAWKQGAERRAHVLTWFAALIAGTANDMIFMALPLVDTFWQAQGTIMLTPRLPLYIPCVYVCFMYFATVSVWRLGLPPLARAALTGMCASLFYAPYDIVGVKFLWWTWHDTDLPISHRILGAPIGSTMWVVLFVATFAWLLGRCLDRDPAASRRTIIKALAMVAGLNTLLFVLQITGVQQLDGGIPGPRGLVVVLVVYAVIVARGWRTAKPWARRAADRWLHAAAVIYFSTLFAVLSLFEPTTHRSASMHQTYGACHVEAKDIAGLTRYQYLCAEDFDEDFTFACAAPPAAGSEWYTVCGRPHTDRARWLIGVGALALAGIAVYTRLLRGRGYPRA